MTMKMICPFRPAVEQIKRVKSIDTCPFVHKIQIKRHVYRFNCVALFHAFFMAVVAF